MEDEIEILANKYDNGEIVSENCELESIYVRSQNDKYVGKYETIDNVNGCTKNHENQCQTQ